MGRNKTINANQLQGELEQVTLTDDADDVRHRLLYNIQLQYNYNLDVHKLNFFV